jgi:hypothetical protein
VTRRPKSRLPPKLPDPVRERAPAPPRAPSTREQLKHARVAGRSAEFGSVEITGVMRRVARNDRAALLGCAPFEGIDLDQVRDAVAAVYGWDGDGPRARIDATRTIDRFEAAHARVLEVARRGGRLAFATGAPASLFTLHRALAQAADAAGGQVFTSGESVAFDSRRRAATRLQWIDRVASVSDGRALLTDERAPHAAEELLFAVGHPDLVVADRSFAGHALARGLEVVAFAGLDALAFAVAEWRGQAVRVVPLDEHRPPGAYQPLVELVAAGDSSG